MTKKAAARNQKVHWLVLLNHSMDDLPVAIFEGPYAELNAKIFAASCDPMGTTQEREAMRTESKVPLCVSLVKFVAGRPVSSEMVRRIVP